MNHMTLSERIVIESALLNKKNFRQIAAKLYRHPTTIANEIRQNRTRILSRFPFDNDCRRARLCTLQHVCGDQDCRYRCHTCKVRNCHDYCDRYVSTRCSRCDTPPYVCNACPNKKICIKEQFVYSAIDAEEVSKRRRSDSRTGPRITADELRQIDSVFVPRIKKGQPMIHIYAEHKDELPVTLRTVYNYIESNEISVKSLDLRRKVRYRRRKRKTDNAVPFNQKYRNGRTYADYENLISGFESDQVVEMDTIKGIREKGKRLLTLFFRKTSVMLLFLLPDGTADSVIRVFDYLESNLGYETFCNLFGIILTDNGSEFKSAEALETSLFGYRRACVYYCDPMASWQKAQIEKNHEYIRYVLPRRKSLSRYDQDDMTLLMNHINSVKRKSLSFRSPYENINENDDDMNALMNLLKMHPVPADEVHLKPDLLIKKN